jgi:formylglycine-generating enzyme
MTTILSLLRSISRIFRWIACLLLVAVACETPVTNIDGCGDGYLDPGEDCDQEAMSVPGCAELGYYEQASPLSCREDCTFNTSTCSGRCGDGMIQVIHGEQCEANQLAGATCQSLRLGLGELGCTPDCRYDTSRCEFLADCGDGQVAGGEECDGDDHDEQTCVTLGFAGGTLGCHGNCTFDTAACEDAGEEARLQSLSVEGSVLSPVFDPDVLEYQATVEEGVIQVSITATPMDPRASVRIQPASPVTLVGPDTEVVITVTAENPAFETTYHLSIRFDGTLSPDLGELIQVPGGTFQRDSSSANLSSVAPFRMSRTEVTRAQFTTVTGLADPSDLNRTLGVTDPVQRVTWYHTLVFCNRLSLREGRTPVYTIGGSTNPGVWGTVPLVDNPTWNAVIADWDADGYRLPTEMEWMWAAMGAEDPASGWAKRFAGDNGSNAIDDHAWYDPVSGATTHPVGLLAPNELGLYDLSGNVWEWCWDRRGEYPTGVVSDYPGPPSGVTRVARGGSWYYDSSHLSVATRIDFAPHAFSNHLGFRVVRR